jgi:hypothetical protein
MTTQTSLLCQCRATCVGGGGYWNTWLSILRLLAWRREGRVAGSCGYYNELRISMRRISSSAKRERDFAALHKDNSELRTIHEGKVWLEISANCLRSADQNEKKSLVRPRAQRGNRQPQRNRNFRELLSAWVEHMLLNGAAHIEETLGNCGSFAVASFLGVPSP